LDVSFDLGCFKQRTKNEPLEGEGGEHILVWAELSKQQQCQCVIGYTFRTSATFKKIPDF